MLPNYCYVVIKMMLKLYSVLRKDKVNLIKIQLTFVHYLDGNLYSALTTAASLRHLVQSQTPEISNSAISHIHFDCKWTPFTILLVLQHDDDVFMPPDQEVRVYLMS